MPPTPLSDTMVIILNKLVHENDLYKTIYNQLKMLFIDQTFSYSMNQIRQ